MIYFSDFEAGAAALAEYTTRVALNTSTGTQDITIAGLGFTPIAAIFTCVKATVDGTERSPANGCIGVATGSSEQGVIAFRSSADADGGRGGSQSLVVLLADDTGTTIDCEASFDSFISNGCRINITNAPASAWFLEVTFFGGSRFASAKAGTTAFSNSSTNDVTVGFETNVLFMASNNVALAGTIASGAGTCAIGFGTFDGTTHRQCSMQWDATHPGGTSTLAGITSSTRIKIGAANVGATFGGVNSTKFTFTTNASWAAIYSLYLALKLTDATGAWCGLVDSPNATGAQTITGPSFTPTQAMIALTTCTADNTVQTDGHGGAIGLASISGTSHCSMWRARDLGTTAGSISDDQAIKLTTHDGGVEASVATFTSWRSDGMNLSFSAANGETHKWPVLFIK